MIKYYHYIIIALLAIYSLLQLFFPRLIAKWDFRYNERNNPSSEYLLKCRLIGGFVLGFLIFFFIIIPYWG